MVLLFVPMLPSDGDTTARSWKVLTSDFTLPFKYLQPPDGMICQGDFSCFRFEAKSKYGDNEVSWDVISMQ